MPAKFNKIIYKIVATLWVVATISACSEYKEITDNELEKIITESLIRQSIVNNHLGGQRKKMFDTLETHKDILDRYGYTLHDFNHTVKAMTMRKSNPLEHILGRVVENIAQEAQIAEKKYIWHKEFQQMALEFYTDTVYSYRGRIGKDFAKFRGEVLGLNAGNYEIIVEYKTMADYKYMQKSIRYYTSTVGVPNKAPSSIWMTRSPNTRTTNSKFSLDTRADSMVVTINRTEPLRLKKREIKKLSDSDTSYISRIDVVFSPVPSVARRDFYNRLFFDHLVYFDMQKQFEQQRRDFFSKSGAYLRAQDFEFIYKVKEDEKNNGGFSFATWGRVS